MTIKSYKRTMKRLKRISRWKQTQFTHPHIRNNVPPSCMTTPHKSSWLTSQSATLWTDAVQLKTLNNSLSSRIMDLLTGWWMSTCSRSNDHIRHLWEIGRLLRKRRWLLKENKWMGKRRFSLCMILCSIATMIIRRILTMSWRIDMVERRWGIKRSVLIQDNIFFVWCLNLLQLCLVKVKLNL